MDKTLLLQTGQRANFAISLMHLSVRNPNPKSWILEGVLLSSEDSKTSYKIRQTDKH